MRRPQTAVLPLTTIFMMAVLAVPGFTQTIQKIEPALVFAPGDAVKSTFSLCGRTLQAVTKSPEARVSSRTWCERAVNLLAGPAELDRQAMRLITPVKVAVDSRDRIIVTEAAGSVVHIYDLRGSKYSRITGADDTYLHRTAGIAVSAGDDIYLTDPELGMVVVYAANGKFRKHIGSVGGERFFERPTGIAIHRESGRIFVSDTPRHLVYVFDSGGKRLATLGKRGGGSAPAEFRRPTDLAVNGEYLYILDQGNSRVQILNVSGTFLSQIAFPSAADMVSLAVNAENRIFLVDEGIDAVHVLDQKGRHLYRFGGIGTLPGQFKRPTGACVDARGQLYVVDSANRRLQVFSFDR